MNRTTPPQTWLVIIAFVALIGLALLVVMPTEAQDIGPTMPPQEAAQPIAADAFLALLGGAIIGINRAVQILKPGFVWVSTRLKLEKDTQGSLQIAFAIALGMFTAYATNNTLNILSLSPAFENIPLLTGTLLTGALAGGLAGLGNAGLTLGGALVELMSGRPNPPQT